MEGIAASTTNGIATSGEERAAADRLEAVRLARIGLAQRQVANLAIRRPQMVREFTHSPAEWDGPVRRTRSIESSSPTGVRRLA